MKRRVIALLLCAVMLVTCMGVGSFAPPDIKLVDESGEAVSEIAIPQSERVEITAAYESESELGYRWQLSSDGETWFNVYGQTGESIQLSYAMVKNMLSDDGTAQVRCVVTEDDSEYTTREAKVSVDSSAPVQTAQYAAAAPARAAAAQYAVAAANEQDTYSIIINYVFADGKQAANPWTATVAAGSSFSQTVTSPTVVGYTPDSASVNVDVTNAGSNKTYTVTYQPAEVEYTVKHYQQNINDDKYTLFNTETRQGYTESLVGENLKKTYDGFTGLLYDTTTKIAADGSTVVEIYYDRNYYLLNLDLDGGYGAEPMYAKYGTPVSIANPEKTGYTFTGWSPALPATIKESTTLKAQWQAGDKAKVTVVIWGENADDEGYSYIKDTTVNATPDKEFSYKTCKEESHTHTADCYSCGHYGSHTLTLACYGLNGANAVDPNNGFGDNDARTHFEDNCNETNWRGSYTCKGLKQYLKNGSVCQYKNGYDPNKWGNATKWEYFYFLYLDGQYYSITEDQYNAWKTNTGKSVNHGNDTYYVYEGKGCTHTHNDSCCTCGKTAHKHSSSCFTTVNFGVDSKLWTLVDCDTITVAADGSSVINVYYDRTEFTLTFKSGNSIVKTIKEKWGKDIHSEFPIKDGNETIWWKVPSGCQSFVSGNNLGSIDTMPHENITFTKYDSQSGAKIYYYVETINGAAGDISYNGKNYNKYKVIDLKTGLRLTYSEEFHDITGFTQGDSNPKLTKDTSPSVQIENFLYYTRNSYTLKFYNVNGYISGEDKSVQYQAPLSSYNIGTPEYPFEEKGAYEFAGWYTTSSCYKGSEVNWDNDTMPANDVVLYAKWVPVTHTVTTRLTEDSSTYLGEYTVSHGKTVDNPPAEDPTRTTASGAYEFVGWFYRDENGVEKAFNFSMEVRKDLDLYAKWRSNTLVKYTIHYQLKDGTAIAPDTTGSALAGSTKTFDAKTGTELNAGYQSGYFPETNSHSLTFDLEEANEYTFVYVPKEKVSYTVKYLEKSTGDVLATEKTEKTSDAVITEKFKQIAGYAPDAYQKRLILSAKDEENVITFWYTKDDKHAPVQTIHYIQNIAGDGYTEYQSSVNLNGVIGNNYNEDALTIPGFSYNSEMSTASGKLTAEGLVLELYYDRIEYPYEFKFLEQGTDKVLAVSENGKARYQAQVTQTAKPISGYTLASAENQAINIAIEDPANTAKKNVKIFYYTENQATISYVAVGAGVAEGICSVSNSSESVKVVTGTPSGSTATIKANDPTYKFVGWYSDADCTKPVSKEATFVPTKNSGELWANTTYYAKFEYNLTSMTLKKEVTNGVYDANDMFIFTIKDSEDNVFARVTVTAGEEVTISGLTVGETYTITEDNNWSWRYANHVDEKIIMKPNAAENVVTVKNTLGNNKWLGASSYAINQCVNTISHKINEFVTNLFSK